MSADWTRIWSMQVSEPAPEPSTSDQHLCPFCTYEAKSQVDLQSHVQSQHPSTELLCPLCQDGFKLRERLEKHLSTSHHVKVEAMQRLMMVVDQQLGRMTSSPADDVMSEDSYDVKSDMSDNDAMRMNDEGMDMDEENFRCTTCNRLFANIDALYAHQNELGHLELKQTPRGPGYLCWKKGCNQYFKTAQALQVHFREIHAKKQQLAISDRHVYKYRCNQCSLAFKTVEKLQMHSQYHAMRAATKCIVCDRAFRTIATMKKHVESTHLSTMKPEQLIQYQAILASMPAALLVNGESNNNNNDEEHTVLDRNHNESPIVELEQPKTPKADEEPGSANNSDEERDFEEMNRKALAEDSYNDANCKFKCHRCKVAFVKQNYLTAHNKTNFHRRGDSNRLSSSLSPIDKYNDPNRPHKCDVCRESFTQKNILIVHYNSVSHLHKLKQQGEKSQSESASEIPETKPYRCNICNVAYTQVSTLEIHMRSVLHQSRASKLQESNEKRINHDERPKSSEPQKERSESVNRPTSLPSMENRDLASMPNPTMLPPLTIPPNAIIPMAKSSQSPNVNSPMSDNQVCQKCGAIFPNQEQLIKHQQMYCYYGLSPNSTQALAQKRARQHRSQVQKNLLENFGFECVMQFNEYNQRRKHSNAGEEDKKQEENSEETTKKTLIPEINKSQCGNCNKEFSSIWVLKAHQEEVHGECVPLDVVEKFGDEYKIEYDKKVPEPEPAPSPPPTKQERSDTPNSDTSSVKTEAQIPTSMELAMSQFPMMPMMQMPGMPLGLPLMGMQPHMMPLMLPAIGDPSLMMPPFMDSGLLSLQKLQQQQQQAAQAAQQAQINQQKRARTRINDDQLKILRAHFDINNSPSEEQVIAMSEQSGLPQKVIKHWFRNTLFKERQRNKDSPYNFNNPPSTTLDLAEYEKTGRICSEPSSGAPSPAEQPKPESLPSTSQAMSLPAPPPPVKTLPSPKVKDEPKPVKQEPRYEDYHQSIEKSPLRPHLSPQKSSTPIPNTSLATTSMMELYLSSQPMISTPISTSPTQVSDNFGIGSMSRRANRTRFTDYQIKILQEYFEQNAYPKDDDLEHLSKMLNLSPRVIVVWFQNARQKARKVYENQPAGEEQEDGRFVRTPGLNYQCKKCMTVFQRYYELIKHQKKHCFKDEDITMNHVFGKDKLNQSQNSNHSDSVSESNASEEDYKRTPEKIKVERMEELKESKSAPFRCEKCSLTFRRFDLWQEHQSIHMMNPSLFQAFAPDSAFGMLQNLAQQQQQKQEQQLQKQIQQQQKEFRTEEDNKASVMKRKIEEEEDHEDQPRDKRLRTTILPEQLDYLYQKYQIDCNPSRKQLETIAADVGLKKRVVQVWFQNTRARERKGQYRAHQQLIHKRCPFCRALFRAKSALESHLATKHPDELAKGDINVDNIPDAAAEVPVTPGSQNSQSGVGLDMAKLMANPFNLPTYMPLMPGSVPTPDPLQNQMKKIYEDSLKRYLDEMGPSRPAHSGTPPAQRSTPKAQKPSDQDMPLDLSKSSSKSNEMNDDLDKSFDLNSSNISWDDSRSENEYDDLSQHPGSPSLLKRSNSGKRYRTQMSSLQIRLMKSLFVDYKTPTMAECEMLGREIGLPKRVIQVWFQNARAKEKKARGGASTPKLEPDQHPDKCHLCDFQYTHKYAIQDHIFTKAHIDNAKKFLQTELDKEQEQSGMMKVPETKSDSVPEVNVSQHPHLAQLQAMGLQAIGLPTPNPAHSPATSVLTDNRNKSTSVSTKKDDKKTAAKDSLTPQMLMPFGPAVFPGQENGAFLPFMYPGAPFYPGLSGVPFMQPGFFPPTAAAAADTMFAAYDPSSYGTPLSLLQIPQSAIRDVTAKLGDPSCTNAKYTQDCRSFSELDAMVSKASAACVDEVSVDVGHICRKCHMVYPAREACVQHQRMLCFLNKTQSSVNILKLDQTQYECRLCKERFSTLSDVTRHCESDGHRSKLSSSALTANLNNSNGNNDRMETDVAVKS